MPPFLITGWVYVLVRLSGTLQKHVFEKLKGVRDVRTFRRELEGKPGEEAARLRSLLDFQLRGWDVANGIAYDDPVDLLGDLAAMGVKTGLLKAGERLGVRVLAALGVKGGTEIVGALVDAVQTMTKIESFLDLIPGLDRFQERYNEAVDLSDPVIKAGIDVAFEIGDLANATVGFIGSFAGIPGPLGLAAAAPAAVNLVKQAIDVVNSILSFFGLVQETVEPFIPEPERETVLEREKRRRREALPPPKKEVEPQAQDVRPMVRKILETREADLREGPPIVTLPPPPGVVTGEFPIVAVEGFVSTFRRAVLGPIANLFAGVGFQQRLVDLLKKDG